jgi:hypothetical protein
MNVLENRFIWNIARLGHRYSRTPGEWCMQNSEEANLSDSPSLVNAVTEIKIGKTIKSRQEGSTAHAATVLCVWERGTEPVFTEYWNCEAAYTAVPAAALRCSIQYHQIRLGYWLAFIRKPLIGGIASEPGCSFHVRRTEAMLPAASGTYVRGWSFTHRFALLHQLGRTQARSGKQEEIKASRVCIRFFPIIAGLV